MWTSWREINQRTEHRPVIFFGTGEWAEKSLKYLNKPADYIVDNNKYEQGYIEFGLKINSPEQLSMDSRQLYVVITTSGFLDVAEQLISYGLKPLEDFCVTPALKNFDAVTRITSHEQTIYLTCSDYRSGEFGGGLYRFHTGTRKLKQVFGGVSHGIAAGNEKLFVVNDDVLGVAILDMKFNLIDTIKLPGKSRPHGICYDSGKELLYINLSSRDSIVVYDIGNDCALLEYPLSGKFNRWGSPQHHLNDLCLVNNLLYVSMFSHSGNWKRGIYDGVIVEVSSYPTMYVGKVIVDGLWMPHTPIVIDNMLHYCDSMRGKVYAGSERLLTQFNGFVRGIAHDGEFYYIGQSMHRYIDRCEGLFNNISLDTGIFMLDPTTKATKFFEIPHLVDINSIFILDE